MLICSNLVVGSDKRYVQMPGQCNNHPIRRVFMKLARQTNRFDADIVVYWNKSNGFDVGSRLQPLV